MKYQNYINGQWVGSADGKTFEQRNPANLEQVTGEWPKSTREDAGQAIESAHAAFAEWSGIGVHKRAEYLSRAVAVMKGQTEQIAAILTEENGKTLDESRTEIGSAVREMEFQIAQGLSMCGETAPSATRECSPTACVAPSAWRQSSARGIFPSTCRAANVRRPSSAAIPSSSSRRA